MTLNTVYSIKGGGNLALCNDVKVQQCFVQVIQKEVKRYDILGSVCLLYCIPAIRLYPTVVPNPHTVTSGVNGLPDASLFLLKL